MTVDAKELILCSDERFICDAFIFEPTRQEGPLGYLFAVGEVEARGGVGQELLDLTLSAIQKEYYRDTKRSPASSFELALHQANLILNDSTARGVKDWMGYFNVAVCVLVGSTLHVSVAGQATVSLVRKTGLTDVSEGLATYPVTNPLRTFSQLASGTVQARDVLYLGTANFKPLFRSEDLKRFAIDHSAHTIVTRLQQLYSDYGLRHPMAALVVSLLPKYIVEPRTESISPPGTRRGEPIHQASLQPRKPIILNRSWLSTLGAIAERVAAVGLEHARQTLWPALKQGSRQIGGQARHGGAALLTASKRTVEQLPKIRVNRSFIASLPRSSKIFAVLTLVFAVALVVSLFLLRNKRVEDSRTAQVSEQLHSAQTAKDAAAAALIYDNRDEAQKHISEAHNLAQQVKSSGLYAEEVAALEKEIEVQQDRLQKIVRASSETATPVGSWSEYISNPGDMRLFVLGDELFTFDPQTNAILKLTSDGKAERVTQTTEGIGFFVNGAVQNADKTIVLTTDGPGVALFETKDNSLLKQEITLPSEQTRLGAVGVFGNRLYLHDETTGQIHTYNKTLRGYTGGEAWIADGEFPKDTIRSIAIDGNIFTLHSDGALQRLFKGVPAEFALAAVEPSLSGATRIITSDEHQYLYIVDPANKRVVIFTKEGELVRQIFIESASNMQDAAVGPDEKNLYILDGAQVLRVSLEEEE